MKRFLAAAGVALCALAAAPATVMAGGAAAGQAPQATMPPKGAHSVKSLSQVPLTLEVAKNAVDSLLLLREKYKDYKFKGKADGPAGVIEAMKNSKVRDEILADLAKHGFKSIDDWVAAFVSVGMAVSYMKRNKDGALQKKIAEIEANKAMAQPVKERLIAMLTALIPPQQNQKVAAELLADPAYAEKIARLMPKRKPRP